MVNFGIRPEMIPVFGEMEHHFQEFVHGENQKIYLTNYMHDVHIIPEDMNEVKRAVEKQRQWVKQLQLEIEEKDLSIRKQIELKRLTDNHVTNLEVMIGNLRQDNENMAQTIAVLNRHEAIIFKVKRKLGEKFNQKFPKGTRKRKILGYVKNTFFHPVDSFRLYDPGRQKLNRRRYEDWRGYRIHGKLKFREEKEPMVSIVIPVYNQIDYTYVCLASILEHTTDVGAYEVIIADDVSTDATMELAKFVEHVTICRNETNQGFLRNCNQAAKAAPGQICDVLK